ncbi:hypothetical protein D3C76_645350 [compost metagenome]
MDARDELFPYFAAYGAARQQMFGAIDLWGLGKNRGATGRHQAIHRIAQRRVGGDARVTVRATALQADDQVARTDRFALHLVRLGQQGLDLLNATGDGFRGAADALDGKRAQLVAGREPLGLEQAFDLVGFTAQADDQHRGKVGVNGVASERAAQQAQGFAAGVHGATGAVGQRHDTVDVREGGQRLGMDVPTKVIGHGPGHGRRTVHRRENADIVARRHAAVGTHDALEDGFGDWRFVGIHAKGVVPGKVAHLHVVHMHMVTRFDGL